MPASQMRANSGSVVLVGMMAGARNMGYKKAVPTANSRMDICCGREEIDTHHR